MPRTAAISAHTNAFKINEDVVIPLPRLAEYNRGIECINIEQAIANKIRICDAITGYLNGELPEASETTGYTTSDEAKEIISNKCDSARELIEATRNRWVNILKNLDTPASQLNELLEDEKNNDKDDLIDPVIN